MKKGVSTASREAALARSESQVLMGTSAEPGLTRLLRCTKSLRYFRRNGWTHDIRQAAVFNDQASAVAACIAHRLYEVELVLRADDREVFRARIR